MDQILEKESQDRMKGFFVHCPDCGNTYSGPVKHELLKEHNCRGFMR